MHTITALNAALPSIPPAGILSQRQGKKAKTYPTPVYKNQKVKKNLTSKRQGLEENKVESSQYSDAAKHSRRRRRRKGVKSLGDKIKDHLKNPRNQFIVGERIAKGYIKTIEDNTMKSLSDTIGIAHSIVEKEHDINDELARQGQNIKKAKIDAAATQYDIDYTSKKLNGMQSIGGHITNVVRELSKSSDYEAGTSDGACSERNGITRNRKVSQCSLPSFEAYQSGSKQEWIKAGVHHLDGALDIIMHQSEAMKVELSQSKDDLEEFGSAIEKIDQGIKNQTKVMHDIRNS